MSIVKLSQHFRFTIFYLALFHKTCRSPLLSPSSTQNYSGTSLLQRGTVQPMREMSSMAQNNWNLLRGRTDFYRIWLRSWCELWYMCQRSAHSALEDFHDDGYRGENPIIFSPISIGVGDHRSTRSLASPSTIGITGLLKYGKWSAFGTLRSIYCVEIDYQ